MKLYRSSWASGEGRAGWTGYSVMCVIRVLGRDWKIASNRALVSLGVSILPRNASCCSPKIRFLSPALLPLADIIANVQVRWCVSDHCIGFATWKTEPMRSADGHWTVRSLSPLDLSELRDPQIKNLSATRVDDLVRYLLETATTGWGRRRPWAPTSGRNEAAPVFAFDVWTIAPPCKSHVRARGQRGRRTCSSRAGRRRLVPKPPQPGRVWPAVARLRRTCNCRCKVNEVWLARWEKKREQERRLLPLMLNVSSASEGMHSSMQVDFLSASTGLWESIVIRAYNRFRDFDKRGCRVMDKRTLPVMLLDYYSSGIIADVNNLMSQCYLRVLADSSPAIATTMNSRRERSLI